MKLYKYHRLSLILVFLFSLIGSLVALWGADAPIHKFKPLISIVWVILMYGFILNKTPNNNLKNTCAVLSWYAFFSLIITAGISYAILTSVFAGEFFFLPYICLTCSCINYQEDQLVSMKKMALLGALTYLIFLFVFRDLLLQQEALTVIAGMAEEGLSLDTITKSFCYPAGLFLLMLPVLNNKNKILVITAFAAALLFSMFLARRNIVVTCLMFAMATVFIYLKNNKNKSFFFKLLSYVVVAIGIYIIVNLAISIFTGANDSVFFAELVRRGDSDSRSHVLIPFFQYMHSPLYWIFGHGINSQYYSDLGWRRVIETGYLQIIMKIGLIGLITYVILIIKAVQKAYRGNILLQACAMYLVIFSLETIYAGVPTFGLTWIYLWITVSICNSDYFKSLTNEQIRDILCQ